MRRDSLDLQAQNGVPSQTAASLSPDPSKGNGHAPIPGPSEDQLIESAILGDEQAFEQLFHRYKNKVYSVCLMRTFGNREMALDVCQETFITAFLDLKKLRDRSRFFQWLAGIARYKSVTAIRKQRSFIKVIEEYIGIRETLHDSGTKWTDLEHELVNELMLAIENPEVKEMVRLFYIEGKKTSEIARIQGITQTSVTTRLNRFRAEYSKRAAQELVKRRKQE